MRDRLALLAFIAASALALTACDARKPAGASGASDAKPFTVLRADPGQIIEYGSVAGAQSLGAAMGSVLREIHAACGEQPKIGEVFRVKNTNTAEVFFTVVDRAQADRPLAGLVIAANTGENQFEVGVVADTASNFDQTANPMMQQLFAAWKPKGVQGGTAADGGSQETSTAAPSDDALHPVTAPDDSATISVPDGWEMDGVSHMGQVILHGPNGELMGVLMSKPAVDPTSPFQQRMAAGHYHMTVAGSVEYAYHGDPVSEVVPLLQAWRKSNGLGETEIEISDAGPMPQQQSDTHCAKVAGKIDPNGKGMMSFSGAICVLDPDPRYGNYSITLSMTMVPLALAEREKGLVKSILLSYRPNAQVIKAGIARMARAKQQQDIGWLQWGQQESGRIRAQGQAAAARFSAMEQSNDAQHAQYWHQQDVNARGAAGFSNYLLDQTVVQNNNVGGTGMAGHSTEWNSTANALVQANPNKYEMVNTPGYWKGVDY